MLDSIAVGGEQTRRARQRHQGRPQCPMNFACGLCWGVGICFRAEEPTRVLGRCMGRGHSPASFRRFETTLVQFKRRQRVFNRRTWAIELSTFRSTSTQPGFEATVVNVSDQVESAEDRPGDLISPAPYASFGNLLIVLDWVAGQPGTPLVDAGVLNRLALQGGRSAQSEVRSTLRLLAIVDSDGSVTAPGVALARSQPRTPRFCLLLERYYGAALRALKGGAGRSDLEALFEEARSAPKTRARAIRLFLDLAEAAGVDVPPMPRRRQRQRPPETSGSPDCVLRVRSGSGIADPYEQILLVTLDQLRQAEDFPSTERYRQFSDVADRIERLRQSGSENGDTNAAPQRFTRDPSAGTLQ